MNSIRRFILPALLFFIFFISGCAAKEENETYFIHCACFERDGEDVKATILFEQLSGKKSNYFATVQKAGTLGKLSEKIKDKYKESYFATCRFYFLTEKLDNEFIEKLAKELCNGNDFPITADVFFIKEKEPKAFLSSMEDGKDLKSLMSLFTGSELNVIRFFACFFSEKDISVPALHLSDEGKAEKDGKVVFNKKSGVVFE